MKEVNKELSTAERVTLELGISPELVKAHKLEIIKYDHADYDVLRIYHGELVGSEFISQSVTVPLIDHEVREEDYGFELETKMVDVTFYQSLMVHVRIKPDKD